MSFLVQLITRCYRSTQRERQREGIAFVDCFWEVKASRMVKYDDVNAHHVLSSPSEGNISLRREHVQLNCTSIITATKDMSEHSLSWPTTGPPYNSIRHGYESRIMGVLYGRWGISMWLIRRQGQQNRSNQHAHHRIVCLTTPTTLARTIYFYIETVELSVILNSKEIPDW